MPREWTPDALMEMGRAFQPACVLAAAADLDVFGALADKPLTAGALAARLGADLRATTILLDALAALRLLSKEGDRYGVPPAIVDTLTEGGSRSVLAMARHAGHILRRWAVLAEVVKTGKLPEGVPSFLGEAGETAAFIGAMDNVSRPLAPKLIRKLKPLSFRHLLDIGGASGTWTIAFLQAVPGARATLFDLPDVVPFAEKRLAEAGMRDRVTVVAGDFDQDPLPPGADLAWLSAIVHMNSREQNRALFAKIRAALDPGGSLMIRDIVMDPSRTRPVPGALFAVNMLVNTEAGGTFTLQELSEDLLAAGFAEPMLRVEGEGMDSVVHAVRP